MLKPHPKSLNKYEIYLKNICCIVILLSFFIWFIFFSEPYKIYRNDKIEVIQYLL